MIISLVIFWYGLIPVAGAFISRSSWRNFRRRFNELCLKPVLDYRIYRSLKEEGGEYRFSGGFESITDSRTLWIRSDSLTIPVDLASAKTYVLPMQEENGVIGSFDPGEEAPERIRWDRVSTLTEGAKVFVGGSLVLQDERWTFVSTKETPLLVVFYDGSDRSMAIQAIRAGRDKNEYWNAVTPYALIAGAFSLVCVAISFLPRPAFRLTSITALLAVFIPLFPILPPGVLFTLLYRHLWWQARVFRAYRDLARLPLRYLSPGEESCILPGGERYCLIRCPSLEKNDIPKLIPEQEKRKKEMWYVCGTLENDQLPHKPKDCFAVYGILPGAPEILARRYTIKAYTLEIISWLALIFGISLNIFFIRIIFILL